jgi:hypothetical protein
VRSLTRDPFGESVDINHAAAVNAAGDDFNE